MPESAFGSISSELFLLGFDPGSIHMVQPLHYLFILTVNHLLFVDIMFPFLSLVYSLVSVKLFKNYSNLKWSLHFDEISVIP